MVDGLEDYSKDQLIAELINRETFVGLVIFHRGDAKSGRLEPGEIVVTKSPPLSREGVAALLDLGQSLVCQLFDGREGATQTPTEMLLDFARSTPLRLDDGGVLRVGNSRISVDLIVEQYEYGMTPEDLVRAYDTLTLADVHATIALYLRRRPEVKAYLERRSAEADDLRSRIELERPCISRQALLARQLGREDAATGD